LTLAQSNNHLPLINIEHATVMRGDHPGLKNFNLRIGQGESLAILGPNGAGKTTLLKLIGREIYPLVKPETRVEICGQEHLDIRDYRSSIGIISQDLQANYEPATPGLEVVISGFFDSISLWQHHDIEDIQIQTAKEMMAQLGVEYLQDTPFGHLSTGQQRRLLLARALVHRPDTLILDEPTTGMDIKASFQYLQLVEQLISRGVAIILVTHHLHEIPSSMQRLVLIKDGTSIFDGAKSDALTDQRLSDLFDAPVHLVEKNGIYQAYPGAK
jgi:iron complex transport system ATP-binding protein